MSVKITVTSFEVEGETQREVAARICRHFGTIADGTVQDSGLAIAHQFEEIAEESVEGPPGEDEV